MQRLTVKKKMVGDFCGWRTIRRNEKIPVLQMLLGFPGCSFYWTSSRLNLLSFATKYCTSTSIFQRLVPVGNGRCRVTLDSRWVMLMAWSGNLSLSKDWSGKISPNKAWSFLTLMMLMAWSGKFSPNKVWSFYTLTFHRTLDMVNSSMGTLVQTGHTLEDNLYCAKVIKRNRCECKW